MVEQGKEFIRQVGRIIANIWFRTTQAVSTEPWLTPLSVAFGTRTALYILMIVFNGLFPGDPETKLDFLEMLAQWDGEWYLRLATNGYQWVNATTQSTLAFFPLYPLLGRIVGFFLGDIRWGMFVVVNVSFTLFLYYLYRLALLDFDPVTAARAIIYAAIFPGAFVLAAFYAEATAFALAVASFYYARVGRWNWAIVLGFFCALARLPGILILFPLAYEYIRQRGWSARTLTLGIVPLGLLAFAAYEWQLSGDPWTLLTIQNTGWFRRFTPPWETLQMAFDRALWPRGHYVVAVNLLDAGTIALFISLTVWACIKMPPAYWLYSLPILIGALSQTVDPDKAPPTAAITRYMMAIFPGYIGLGQLTRNAFVDQAVRWTFALLMSVFAVYFFSRFWVL